MRNRRAIKTRTTSTHSLCGWLNDLLRLLRNRPPNSQHSNSTTEMSQQVRHGRIAATRKCDKARTRLRLRLMLTRISSAWAGLGAESDSSFSVHRHPSFL